MSILFAGPQILTGIDEIYGPFDCRLRKGYPGKVPR
jgi:hypothetical protein